MVKSFSLIFLTGEGFWKIEPRILPEIAFVQVSEINIHKRKYQFKYLNWYAYPHLSFNQESI
jgi:hypothetical protein